MENNDGVRVGLKAPKFAVVFGLLIIGLILFALFCVRTVDAGQVGVITRFGEVSREVQSGIAIKMPWPIEKLYKIEARTQKEDLTANAASKDLQDANANLAVNYSIDRNRATDVYKTVGIDYKDKVLVPAITSSFKGNTTAYTAEELLTKRPEVEEATLNTVRNKLEQICKQDGICGINVSAIAIVDFGFSTEFTAAIEAKQVAQQEAQRAVFVAEKAKQEAQAEIERAKGSAEAQRLQQSTLTAELLQKQAIEKWDGKLPVYSTDGNLFFNIPAGR